MGMIRFYTAMGLCVLLLTACVSNKKTSEAVDLTRVTQEDLIGIWAMIPLNNGIANVVTYTEDGKSTVYPYNCTKESDEEPSVSTYTILKNGHTIRIENPQDTFDLNVTYFSENLMKTNMDLAGVTLNFSYIRRSSIEPLCNDIRKFIKDRMNKGAYEPSNFKPAPQIPENANISAYVGKWANSDGNVQIAIKKDVKGEHILYNPSNKYWHYLYNDVQWKSDALHYQAFAYSDDKSLFSHAFHKLPIPSILEAMAPEGKMKYRFFINGKSSEYILNRLE